MQIRCTTCTKTIAIAAGGALPRACPHCREPAVPDRLGPYLPERLVATGGMGEVYLARHDELGTEVAIKVLPAMPLDVVADVRRRFAREARLTAKVDHPGVVRVLQSEVQGDRPFLVLEFVDGVTLRQRLEAGPLPVVDAARIAAECADVLAAAHDQGVLHRDIKPDNVMLDADGRVRVLDFGIARAVQEDAPLTRTGELVGTPEYMAPEQLLDGAEAIDARTDVHALGVLLYELLTGRSPYRGANLFQALKLVESLEPKPPSTLVAAVPEQLDAVIARALHKSADDRFASARAFAAAVREAVPAAARPPAAPVAAARPGRELLGVFAAAFASSLLFCAALWWLVPDDDPPTDATERHTASAEEVQPVPAGERADLRAALAEGRWSHVLDEAMRAWDAGDPTALAVARRAFLWSHCVWTRTAQLPAWQNACDLHQRRRLFGDVLEPANAGDAEATLLMAGDEQAWTALQQHPGALPAAARDLLAARELPAAQRADALASFAQRLPIDCPEHWLARTIERHLRGDRTAAEQAAEMADLAAEAFGQVD
ncbi:MAG: serine/threonine protein kinase [Planctomycetes bacterium]|nr:serine/threonine protein kinase [Planctomycetota bacterium]